jgi:hypothetical protein
MTSPALAPVHNSAKRAQVAQFIEGSGSGFYNQANTPLNTVAEVHPGATAVTLSRLPTLTENP